MLTKRTNLLFEEDLWNRLVSIANEKNTSVGDLVRQATRRVYIDSEVNSNRKTAFATILSTRVKQKSVDYKKLINHGRKII
jgi:hypothetical protein